MTFEFDQSRMHANRPFPSSKNLTLKTRPSAKPFEVLFA